MKFEPFSQRLTAALSANRKHGEARAAGWPSDSLEPIRRPATDGGRRQRRSLASDPQRATALLTPSLSYGRHRGPAPASARRAAVAVVWLRCDDGSWTLPLTLRAQHLRHHGGQVCFPGGRIEAGETPAQAALREFQEELGHAPVDPLMCGELEPLYVYASNNLVFPIVFAATAPSVPWNPDPVEVQRVLEMPLATLLHAHLGPEPMRWREITRGQRGVGGFRFRSTAYRLEGHRVWGATAMMLAQLADLIRSVTAPTNAVATN